MELYEYNYVEDEQEETVVENEQEEIRINENINELENIH